MFVSILVTGFVDKHRAHLIQRVSSVMEIADTLLTKEIISNEMYNAIKVANTTQEKMRTLHGFLDPKGRDVKAEFFKVLKKKEGFLVNDLNSRY